MAQALVAFYDQLMPELKGITTAMVDLHLVQTARDLCERTSCWRVAFTASTVAAEPTYDISAPEPKSEVVRLTRMAIDSVLLWNDSWHDPLHRALWGERPDDAPKYRRNDPPFTMNPENTEFTLISDELPGADGSDNIALIAALKPSFTATTLPDLLKFELLEGLRAGTLARLMRMGGKPWTDRELASFYALEYGRLCGMVASHAQGGNTKQRLRVRKAGI